MFDELQRVETVFNINIVVYELGELSAQLVRRSLGKHDVNIYVNLFETHYSYIRDMKSYSHSYLCRKCEDSIWNTINNKLDDEGIYIIGSLRATFDFDRENLPADTDRMELVARHVPLCVSVASNVPGYEAPQCFVTNGDSNNLVTNMMKYLETISDAAFKSLKRSYKSELDTN